MQAPFFLACALLLIGIVLRARVRALRSLFIPASVVAGLLGFALLQLAASPLSPTSLRSTASTISDHYRSWPSFLIAVVFAGMLLDHPSRGLRQSLRLAAREGLVVWFIILGQIATGLLVTWLVLAPLYHVPLAFGQLLEVSWAGGFGSANAMGDVYTNTLHFPQGRDLAVFFAATGLLWGVASGIALVNLGARRQWTRKRPVPNESHAPVTPSPGTPGEGRGEGSAQSSGDLALPSHRAAGGRDMPVRDGPRARTSPTPLIEPLLLQSLLLALAFSLGWALQFLWNTLALHLSHTPSLGQLPQYLTNLPLFLFTLLGGLLLRTAAASLNLAHHIDPTWTRRLTSVAMEFLIVSSLASLRVSSLVDYGPPVAFLLLTGAAWCALTLVWPSRRLLPRDHWFELALINYGMATATTAQGMMLLRMVDPDLDSGAAEDYALAAPLSAPFIGGGLITFLLPLLLQTVHVAWILVTCAVIMGLLHLTALRLSRAPAS